MTELKLLATPVGVIVLSAGVGNDVVGWILLALCVALVNAGSGLTALWVLLVAFGYTLLLVYVIRPAFLWVLRYTRSLQDGPSQGIVALTLLMALTSAFFTGIIGIHPIFGAFMVGLICPHEGGFAIKVTEKVEDLVSTLFLPLYFALSGLSTNLGLLNSGMVWAYVVGVIAVAFFGKFIGASVAARANGLVWRECFTIGSLMSCKGLVELIVLNIGLQAGLLGQQTFTIFVVMALVTTFATTPLTSALYPPWYQKKLDAWKRGEIDWDTGAPLGGASGGAADELTFDKLDATRVQRLLIYLRLDSMPALMALLALFGPQLDQKASITHPAAAESSTLTSSNAGKEPAHELVERKKPLVAHGVRLLELTERDSSVMKVAEMEELSQHDPVVNTFRTFGHIHSLGISGEVAVTPESGYADALTSKAEAAAADLLLLPWTESGSMSESIDITTQRANDKLQTPAYSAFVEGALRTAPCTVGVFVSKNFGGVKPPRRPQLSRSYSIASLRSKQGIADPNDVSLMDRSHHIFFPFFGGADDRAALRLLMQLAASPDVTVTAVYYQPDESYYEGLEISQTLSRTPTSPKSPSTAKATPTPLTAEVEATSTEQDATIFSSLRASLPADVASRVALETSRTNTPVTDALLRAEQELGQKPRNAGDLIVLGRSISQTAAFTRETSAEKRSAHEIEASGTTRGPLGVLAEKVVGRGISASVLVIQAKAQANE